MNRRSTIIARLVVCAWIAGMVLLVVMIIARITISTRDEPYSFALGPFELRINERISQLFITYQGDASWQRHHLTSRAWINAGQPLGYWRHDDPSFINKQETIGTPVGGRRVRVTVPSALLLAVCLLPAIWRWGKAVRSRRAALRDGHCAMCGYDLRASGERCPECGADQHQARGRWRDPIAVMWRTRRVLTIMMVLSMLPAIAIITWTSWPEVSYRSSTAIRLPGTWELDHEDHRLTLYNCGDPLHAFPSNNEWLGITYSTIEWTNASGYSTRWITLSINIIYPILLSLIVPLHWLRIALRRKGQS